jgi:biotin transporter BioY
VVLLPNPWIALIVLVVIPVLTQSKSGPTMLTKQPHALYAWPFLIAIAAAGLIRGPWFTDASIGMPAIALFAAPLTQAAPFVILYQGFTAFAQRVPVTYDEARRGRQPNGRRHVADRVFWLATGSSSLLSRA